MSHISQKKDLFRIINIHVKYNNIYVVLRNVFDYSLEIKILNRDYYKFVDEEQLSFFEDDNPEYFGEFEIIFTNFKKNDFVTKKKMYLIKVQKFYNYYPGLEYFKKIDSFLWQFKDFDFTKLFDKDLENSYENDIPYIPYIMSFDIEVITHGSFPKDGLNPISHICCHIINKFKNQYITLINSELYKNGKESSLEYLEKIINKKNQTSSIFYFNEIEMLKAFNYILNKQYDYVLTYNGNGFDWPYLFDRIKVLNTSFKILDITEKYKDLDIKTDKYQNFIYNHITSFINFDIYKFITLNIKDVLDKRLDTIATKQIFAKGIYQGDNVYFKKPSSFFKRALCTAKNISFDLTIRSFEIINEEDVIIYVDKYTETPKEEKFCINKTAISLIEQYADYNESKAKEIGEYCIHDAHLCSIIFDSFLIHEKTTTFMKICGLSPKEYLDSKSNKKIMNELLKLCLKEKKAIVNLPNHLEEEFPGAVVFDIKKSFSKSCCAIFDFASLYPNTIYYCNLSPETNIYYKKVKYDQFYPIYNELLLKYPWPDYFIMLNPNLFDLEGITESEEYITINVFSNKEKGIIPLLVKHFVDVRKTIRKKIFDLKPENPNYQNIYNYLDSEQLMVKILANSIYGLTSSKYFSLESINVAQSCTSFSRWIELFIYYIIDGSCMDFKKKEFTVSKYLKNLMDKNLLKYPATSVFFKETNIKFEEEILFETDNIEFEILYGDTDSVFINIKDYISKETDVKSVHLIFQALNNIINNILKITYPNHSMEYEGFIKNVIFSAKKKYIGSKYANNSLTEQIYYKGLNITRRDVPPLKKRITKEVYNIFKNNILFKIKIIEYLKKTFNEELEKCNREDYLISTVYHFEKNHFVKKAVEEFNEKKDNEIIESNQRIYYMYSVDLKAPYNKKIIKEKKTNYVEIIPIIDKQYLFDKTKRPMFEYYFDNIISELGNMFKTDDFKCCI